MPFHLAPHDSCSFCEYLAGTRECAFIVREELASAFVNRTQYERGAMLIVPNAHRATILDISETEIAAVYALARRLAAAAERAFGAVGTNVFQNNGLKASQHMPHFHVHVVPRYPDSDSEKVFLQRDFSITPADEQHRIAETIRRALAD